VSVSGRHACVHGGAWLAAGPRLEAARAEARPRRPAAQVVFATETLAAGINMPARTTVLSTISRRRNAGHTPLQHNELLQMAGRAGRRGYDTAGAPRAPSRAPAAACERAPVWAAVASPPRRARAAYRRATPRHA